jgi:hypothetical protein
MNSRLRFETGAVLRWQALQAKADGLLVKAEEGQKSEDGVKKGLSIGVMIVIGAGALLCLVPICIIIVLTLMGPSIGTVFSNIIENLPSPTP